MLSQQQVDDMEALVIAEERRNQFKFYFLLLLFIMVLCGLTYGIMWTINKINEGIDASVRLQTDETISTRPGERS